jgi:hypothetical protein
MNRDFKSSSVEFVTLLLKQNRMYIHIPTSSSLCFGLTIRTYELTSSSCQNYQTKGKKIANYKLPFLIFTFFNIIIIIMNGSPYSFFFNSNALRVMVVVVELNLLT